MSSELSQEELEAKREELIQETRQEKEEFDRKKADLLESVKEDDEVGNYEWVTIGAMEFKIQLWIPGEELKGMTPNMSEEEMLNAFDDLESLITVLTNLTDRMKDKTTGEVYTDSEYIRQFWDLYFEELGTDATVAVERILVPVLGEIEDKSEGLKSFQSEHGGSEIRDGDDGDWEKRRGTPAVDTVGPQGDDGSGN